VPLVRRPAAPGVTAVIAAVAIAGVAACAAAGRWDLATLGAAGGAIVALWARLSLVLAVAVVLSVALPLVGVPWMANYAVGLGLLTLLLAVFAVALAWIAVCDRGGIVTVVRDVLRNPLTWGILGLLAWVAASLVLAPRGPDSLRIAREYAGRETALPLMLAVGLLSLGPAAALAGGRRLAGWVIATGVAGSVLAVIQMAGNVAYLAPHGELSAFVGERATGLSEHPGTWAAFAVVALALAGARWLHGGGRMLAAFVVLLSAGTVLAGARAAWLSALACCLLVVVTPVAPLARRVALVALVFAGVGISAVVWKSDTIVDAVRPDHSSAGGGKPAVKPSAPVQNPALGAARIKVDESAKARIVLTTAELELGVRKPVTGVGLGNIGPAMVAPPVPAIRGKTRADAGFTPGEPIEKHNTYAGLFAELGVAGPLLFAWVLLATLRLLVATRRRVRDEKALVGLVDGLLAALVATAVTALFTDADRQPFLWWICGLALTVGLAVAARERAQA
jgi:hypothetical protein